MAESTKQNAVADDTIAPSPGWRFRVGVGLIVLSFVSPLGALLVSITNLSIAMKATLSGLFLAGIPEVLTVAAIAVMGKAGFAYVKNSIMVLLRRYGPPKEVGPIRYYIGLVMWLLPAAYSWILMYATPEMIPGFPEYRIHMALTFDFIFICSFFVLGGDFWDKVRALFIHKAKVRFPEPNKA